MIDFIFFIIGVVLILLAISFYLKNYPLGMISAMATIIIGVYILIYDIQGIDNILVLAMGIMFTCIGAYILINGTIQQIYESGG